MFLSRFSSTPTIAGVLARLVCLPADDGYKSQYSLACLQDVLLIVVSHTTSSTRLDPRQVATNLVMTVIDFMAVQVVRQFISVETLLALQSRRVLLFNFTFF